MIRLHTSPTEIMRWLGVAALHNSDNLKPLKDDAAAKKLRVWWRGERQTMQQAPEEGGGDDAA